MTARSDHIIKGAVSLQHRFIVHPSSARVSGGHYDRGGREPSSKETLKWFQELVFLSGTLCTRSPWEKAHRASKTCYKLACKPWGNGTVKTSVCSHGFQVKTKHNFDSTSKRQRLDKNKGTKAPFGHAPAVSLSGQWRWTLPVRLFPPAGKLEQFWICITVAKTLASQPRFFARGCLRGRLRWRGTWLQNREFHNGNLWLFREGSMLSGLERWGVFPKKQMKFQGFWFYRITFFFLSG